MLVSPLADSSSEMAPAVGYARLPLPSVNNSLVPDLVWCQHFRIVCRSRDPGASVAVGSGGSVPRGALTGVNPFIEARVCLQEHYVSRVGLCRACGGLWPSPAPHRDSSNGSGFHSQPDLLSSVVASGSTNSRGTRLLRRPFIYSAMWV